MPWASRRGQLCRPEKRKVGSSTVPLTTRSDQAILPSRLRKHLFGPKRAAAARCPLETAGDRPRPITTARRVHDLVAIWMQTSGTSLVAVERCSLLRMWTSAEGSRSPYGLLYLSAVREWQEVYSPCPSLCAPWSTK
jgi:hypothetical protein